MNTAELQPSPLQGIRELRLANMRWLSTQYGGTYRFGRILGYANGTYVSQLIGKNPVRPITENLARRVETELRLPIGWLDLEHANQIYAKKHQGFA